jgi:Tol biopolymer transport system component
MLGRLRPAAAVLGAGAVVVASAAPALAAWPGTQNGLVVYVDTISGPVQLWTVNPASFLTSRLTLTGDDKTPSVSPDGQSVVFTRNLGTGGTGDDLYEIPLSAPESAINPATQLTSAPGAEDEPSWVDGTHVIYVGAGTHGTSALHELDLGTHTDTVLLDDGVERRQPVLDPASPNLLAYWTPGGGGQ